jgi:ribosomal-protein-alanine N-acetyltransferase
MQLSDSHLDPISPIAEANQKNAVKNLGARTVNRIFLRPWTSAIATPLYHLLSDPELYVMLPAPPPLNELEFRRRHDRLPYETATTFSVHLAHETVTVIGMIEARLKCPQEYEIGFMLGRSYWGKGFATEMIGKFLCELSSRQGSLTVHAAAESRNLGSIQALRKNGFMLVEERETILKFQPSLDVILRRSI